MKRKTTIVICSLSFIGLLASWMGKTYYYLENHVPYRLWSEFRGSAYAPGGMDDWCADNPHSPFCGGGLRQ